MAIKQIENIKPIKDEFNECKFEVTFRAAKENDTQTYDRGTVEEMLQDDLHPEDRKAVERALQQD